MENKDTIKVALIGAGRIGQLHAQNIVQRIPSLELVGVADVVQAAAEELAQKYALTSAVTDFRQLLDLPTVDAVLICSATDTHAEIAQLAAKAGKHIFCEKPIDFRLDKIEQTLSAVEAAGVKFQVGFNRRFDPSFRRVRQLVADGSVGAPHLLRITSRDPAPPPIDYIRSSGGLFMDMTIHDFDMARYLMGSDVTRVYASGGVLVDDEIGRAGDIDTAIISLEFANGAFGTIDNSRKASYGYDQRVEVFGSSGMAAAENETPDRHVLADETGIHGPKPLYFFLERYTASYIAELEAFAASILDDSEVQVGGVDGKKAVVIAKAAQMSLRDGRSCALADVEAEG